jgi:aminoglycoside 3-N-acetyltransferase
VHSSLSVIGYVDGGADAVIDALLETVGPSGTILMPTYALRGTMLDYAKTNPLFDPKNTPSYMGKITEVFRCRKEALRSLFPTHPVAAIGPHAEYLLKDHEKGQLPFGRKSPFFKLIGLDGYIMLIGCWLERLSSTGVLEDITDDLPIRVYLDEPIPLRYLDHAGVEHTILVKVRDPKAIRNRVNASVNVKRRQEIYDHCLQYGCLKPGKVGNATTYLIRAKGLENVLEALLPKHVARYIQEV